mmetsp:Transcript_15276/g.42195  ORF Transcript_15276/g.42195 Transcript_15276/m.42195 type:complete len:208 (-) Transcript_15276:31-654(-)
MRSSSPLTNMRVAVLARQSAPSSLSPRDSWCGAARVLPAETAFVFRTGLPLNGPWVSLFSSCRCCRTKGSAEMSVECLAAAAGGGAEGAPRLSSMMALAWSWKALGSPALQDSPSLSCANAFWNCANVRRPEVASTEESKRDAAGVKRTPCRETRACAKCGKLRSSRIAAEKSSCTDGGLWSPALPSVPPPKIRLKDVGSPRCIPPT